MEKILQIFNSHEEAEKADVEFYRSLTGEERLKILFALVNQYSAWFPDAAKGLERVHCVVEPEEREAEQILKLAAERDQPASPKSSPQIGQRKRLSAV